MNNDNWKPFFFEGNLAFGEIECLKDWERIKNSYSKTKIDLITMVKRGHEDNKMDYPFFGLGVEFNGESLGKWAEKNNMNLKDDKMNDKNYYEKIAELLKPLGFQKTESSGFFYHEILDKTFDFSNNSLECIVCNIFETGKKEGEILTQERIKNVLGLK